MDTKRCIYCHKLARADARSCKRCGRPFGDVTVPLLESDSGLRASIPPASPHRTGHHPGLHPEDQPYQSSMLPVQRPPKQKTRSDASVRLQANSSVQQKIDEERVQRASAPTELAPTPQYLNLPVTPLPHTDMAYVAPSAVRKSKPVSIPVILTSICLILLVASSILAYVFINKRAELPTPILRSTPAQLRLGDTFILAGSNFGARDLVTFTRDANIVVLAGNGQPLVAHTDNAGTFLVQITTQTNWGTGEHFIHATDETQKLSISTSITIQQAAPTPPRLQLSASSLDFGAGPAGKVSNQNIILTNAGGGQVTWQASSNRSWLTVNPGSGTFSGKTVVTLSANRGTLQPQAYDGMVTFTQQGSNTPPLTVHVTMTVQAPPAAPANLLVYPSTVNAWTTTGQNPAAHTITLQNNGGQELTWQANSTTNDGANWLSVTPASGLLEPDTSVNILLAISAASLGAGSYQGTLTFSYGSLSQQVAVTLTVSPTPAAAIGIQPNTLAFTTIQGSNPQPRTFSITDTGNATLDWSLSEDQNGKTFVAATPTSGSLAPGKSQTITVTPHVANASAGTINATITIADSDAGTTVQKQSVGVSIAINAPPMAAISLSTQNLTFNNTGGLTITTQPFTITNTGTAALDWSLSSTDSWLTVDPTSGTLAPGQSITLYAWCDSNQLQPGNYTASLTVSGSSSGTSLPSQTIKVSLTAGP